jgi:hypothetical protein
MEQHKHKNSFDLSNGGAGEVRKMFMTSQQQVPVNNTRPDVLLCLVNAS